MFLAALLGFAAGVLFERPTTPLFPVTGFLAQEKPQGLNTDLIQQAYDIIQENYADQASLEETNLTYAAIDGMVNALGDTGHSRFLTPQMVEAERRSISGEFEGIGALLYVRDGQPIILAPMDNSPAQRAGLRAGDIILEVDGEEVADWSLTEIVQQVQGPAGTDVTLTVQHPETDEIREVTITRARINAQNVTWQILPGTKAAHIRIAQFSEDVGDNLRDALMAAKSQGAEGVILDLRNNPGGLLSEAVEVTSQFLSSGNVLLEKNAEGQTRPVRVRTGGVAIDVPLVVLINEGSASASEIVSGALQDYDRATLVGETTFGTGTVLLTFPLEDSSALLLATEMWLTPEGRVIWHEGIEPDVVVEQAEDILPSLPQNMRDLTEEDLRNLDDAQLLKALEILQERIARQPAKN